MESNQLDSELLRKTLELFDTRSRSLTVEVIHDEEPLLTLGWLRAFNREGLDPSIKRTETLYNYLLKKKSEAEEKEPKNEKN